MPGVEPDIYGVRGTHLQSDWNNDWSKFHRHAEFQDMVSQPRVPALNFLAHEDVALKAYFESRGRYLGRLPPRRAFNQIGEVLPTIIHRGQVIGTWAWDASKMAVAYSIMRGYGSLELSKAARRQANALSQTLRLRWV